MRTDAVIPIRLEISMLAALCAVTCHAQDDGIWARMRSIVPKGYVCYKTTSNLNIDGQLDDDAWQAAPWTDKFSDIEGAVKPEPRLLTRAKMLWNDEYFYIGARLEEPHVWGTLTEHDSVIFHDNDFEVFIDPNGDNHEYYEFEMNALNTGWDLLLPKPYMDGGRADNGWEIPGLQTAVHVQGTLNDPTDTDDYWSVEIAIPWKVLGEFAHRPSPPLEGDQWRVNFSRVQWRHEVRDNQYRKVAGLREDNWVWSPQGIINMHRPERWGYVQFAEGPPGRVEFKKDPNLPAREALMTLYHRQRAFHKRHGRWATSLDELGSSRLTGDFPSLTLEATAGGFQASISPRGAEAGVRKWSLRQDSKLWPE